MAAVLLARPHPVIVAEMAPLLRNLGLVPVRLESPHDLSNSCADALCRRVVSLAVSSSVSASLDTALAVPAIACFYEGEAPANLSIARPSFLQAHQRATAPCIYASKTHLTDPARQNDRKTLLKAHSR